MTSIRKVASFYETAVVLLFFYCTNLKSRKAGFVVYLHNLQTYMTSAQQIRVFWDVKHHYHQGSKGHS